MSYWRLYYHFVWTTKRRAPLIEPSFKAELYASIAAKTEGLGAILHALGGIEEHVHLAASVPPKIPLATFVGQVKGNSSHFVNHVIKPDFVFQWQAEYGVVSFGEKHLPFVVRYIHNQQQHHANNTTIARLELTNGN